VHCPDAGQVSSQLPPEQSVVHGGVAQDALQLPEEQLQLPPVHEALLRAPPVPGSAMGGPPFGVPVVVEGLEPLQAATTDRATKPTYEERISALLPRQTIRSGVGYSPPR
jgi:hypothetical protein